MHVLVKRISQQGEATLSLVSINGIPQCWGLEDGHNEVKIAGETRIPAGTYKLGVRDEGGFHNRYSKKFPKMHRGMLEVKDVPNFEYILIHVGNDKEDTRGCLLIGSSPNLGREHTVSSSVVAYTAFYPKLIAAAMEGRATIEYRDVDSV